MIVRWAVIVAAQNKISRSVQDLSTTGTWAFSLMLVEPALPSFCTLRALYILYAVKSLHRNASDKKRKHSGSSLPRHMQ